MLVKMEKRNEYADMKKALLFLDSLPIDDMDNALWNCLHQVVWHKGVDRVRWLLENKELVQEIAGFKIVLPDDLKEKFWTSVYKLKNLE